MRLDPRKDTIVDAMLREWGRWRRLEMTEAGAPRKYAQGSSWHHHMERHHSEETDPNTDPGPDDEVCCAIQRAYERLKADGSGYDVVIRDYYVDGTGWPPALLLRHARYLIWRHGG